MKLFIPLLVVCLTSIFCKKEGAQPQNPDSKTYYIVRHAEKDAAVPSNDPPLSNAGTARAMALRDSLVSKEISAIFSTSTNRTLSTAHYTSQQKGITVQTYGPIPDAAFITQLKQLPGNILIVGHSNTVDDIVNGLCGETKIQDLAESEYGDLFVVTISGTLAVYSKKHFGN